MDKNRQNLLQSLIEKLVRTVHDMHMGQNFLFGNMLLSRKQIMALSFIYDNGNAVSVNSLAKFLHVTPGAVTQLVNGLVDKRMLRREANKIDRRVINIKLTPPIEKKFNAFKQKYLINSGYFFDGLDDKDISLLISLLDKVKIPISK